MKTIKEFIKEINGSKALQNELKAVKGKDALEAVLKKNDCGFTAEEFVKALNAEGVISDDDAEAAAGGDSSWNPFSLDISYVCPKCGREYDRREWLMYEGSCPDCSIRFKIPLHIKL